MVEVSPGFYGHKFLPEVLNKVRELLTANQKVKIGIDGGIKQENIDEALKSGADLVYVGSGIFLQKNPQKNFFEFEAKVEKVGRNS